MARNRVKRQRRNADIRAFYKALYDKNKVERKYRTEYLLELTAEKFYLTARSIYAILRESPEENQNQLTLFKDQ